MRDQQVRDIIMFVILINFINLKNQCNLLGLTFFFLSIKTYPSLYVIK